LGVEVMIEQNFSAAFAAVEARDFVTLLRQHLPGLAGIYVGENWRFGRGRLGDVPMLVEQARQAGLTVFSAPGLNYNGAPISSSRIRERLGAGDMAEVNAMLGYSYFTSGVVEQGRQLGRTIGFPTLNLRWEPELKPAYGVYAVEVVAAGMKPVKGVANYGVRPTVGQTARPLFEVHLLEAPVPSYGDEISVQWLQFLRPESKFGNMDELRSQIEKDRQNALNYFRK
jgi:riboflavin kinase/FMN adenylyltransferase